MIGAAIQAGGAYLRFFADASEYYRTMGEVEARFNSFAQKFGNMGVQWTAMGTAMMAPVMFGVKEYAKLEQYMLSIKASLRDNVAEVEKSVARLHAMALQIGVDTEFDATQVAAAMEKLAIGDFSDTQIEVAIRPVIDYAAIAKIAPDVAAELVYQIMSSQKMTANDIPKIVDMLATASRLTTKPPGELAYAQSTSGGLLHTLGVPLSEQLAVQTVLMRMMSGERAGTGLRSAALSLLSPSKDAKKKLAANGIVFEGEDGSFSLITMLQSFERVTDGWSKIAKGKLLGDLFDNRQVEILADILGMSQEVIALKERLEKRGTAATIAGEKRAGVAFGLDVVNSTLDTLRVNFGEALRNDVLFLADKFAKLLQWLAEFIRQNPNVARGFALIAASIFSIGTAMLSLAAGSKFLAMLSPLFVGGPVAAGTLAAPAGAVMGAGLIARFPALAVFVGLLAAKFFDLDTALVKTVGTLFLMWRGWLFLSTTVWPLVISGAGLLMTGISAIASAAVWAWGAFDAFILLLMVSLPEVLGIALAVGVVALAIAAFIYLLPDLAFVTNAFFSNLTDGVGVFFGKFYDSISETMGMVVDLLLQGDIGMAAETMWEGIKLAFFDGLDAIMQAFVGLNEFLTVMMKEVLIKGVVIQRSIKFTAEFGWFNTVDSKRKFDLETQAAIIGIQMIPDNFLGLQIQEKANALRLQRDAAAGKKLKEALGEKAAEDEGEQSRMAGSGFNDGSGGGVMFRETTQRRLESLGKYELRRAEGDNLLIDLLSPKTSEKTPMGDLVSAAKMTAANTASLKDMHLVGVMPK